MLADGREIWLRGCHNSSPTKGIPGEVLLRRRLCRPRLYAHESSCVGNSEERRNEDVMLAMRGMGVFGSKGFFQEAIASWQRLEATPSWIWCWWWK